MGIYINSYGIKIDEINAILGCGDDKVYAKYKKDLQPFLPVYPEDAGISSEKALEILIYNKTDNPADEIKPDLVFLFVIFQICLSLTKKLPNSIDLKIGPDTGAINYYLRKDFKKRFHLDSLLFSGNFDALNLPHIFDDLEIDPYECPVIGLIPCSALPKIKSKFKNVVINDSILKKMCDSKNEHEVSKAYHYQSIKWVQENIDYCIDNNLDMLSVCG
jgi:hypothetical protein